MNLEEITLIVPTKNEASNIEYFLDSVPCDINIIIVDASTDSTFDIIKSRKQNSIKFIKDNGNIAAARQLAAKHAKTDWLLFSDADVAFAKNFFEILSIIDLSAQHAGLIGAKLSRKHYQFYYRLFSQWLKMCCTLGLPGASGSNMLVKRRALMEVGGFDLHLSCNEDTELIWRLQKNGFRVDFDGRLKVYEFDHRRLDQGILKKTIHSLTRCALLLLGLNAFLKKNDWGYWRSRSKKKSLTTLCR
jgi:glycosyltransferase involved in cell wall biosynthesis